MTKNISEEELLLRKRARRRLLGAVTLVITAVIILPMIFDEEPQLEQQEIAIQIPSEDFITDFSPTLLDADNLPVIDPRNSSAPAEPLPFDTVEIPFIEDSPREKLVHQNITPTPRVKPRFSRVNVEDSPMTSHATTSASAGLLEFVVQLGAFSDHSKARQQQQNLVSNGVKAYTETLRVDGKEMMRVRVGPFSTRISAENELRKLNQLGLNGVVTAR